jgi:transposase InsO family protein
MITPEDAHVDKQQQRFDAVLAVLQGQALAEVEAQYHLCRSDLYKFKRRALTAMQAALADHKRGPRRPANRIPAEQEHQIKAVCERHPTWSSYQVRRSLSPQALCARAIQRVRQRLGLPRLPKRPVPCRQDKRFSADEQRVITTTIQQKCYLGPRRLAWDIHNEHGVHISRSTCWRRKRRLFTKPLGAPPSRHWQRYERHHPHSLWHGDLLEKVTLTDEDRTAYQLTWLDDYSRTYVFCDVFREVTVLTTIQSLIAAMRAYQTIPRAIVCDNGTYFKGKLFTAFCQRLGIRLIHSAVNHPQTNGKLERAFRDDMNEFYHQHPQWIFEELQRDLPAYLRYRNEQRGHYALQGQPAITRMQEQHFFALPTVLEQLECYAWCERGQKIVDPEGRVQINGRTAKISPRLSGQRLNLYETLDGLEAQAADGTCYLVRNYRPELCRPRWYGKTRRWVYTFERQVASLRIQDSIPLSHTHEAGRPVTSIGASPNCPRIAVAL